MEHFGPVRRLLIDTWRGARRALLMAVLTAAAPNALPAYPPVTANDWVQEAYVAYYGRPADDFGLAYWAYRLTREGGSLSSIIDAFGNSDEFNRRYGGLDATALVTKIYQQSLNRPPDPAGLDYYVRQLQAGLRTLQTITLDMLNGAFAPPDSTVVANRLAVAAYYTAKVEAGCAYGTELGGATTLAAVTADAATVTAVMQLIDRRCGGGASAGGGGLFSCPGFATTEYYDWDWAHGTLTVYTGIDKGYVMNPQGPLGSDGVVVIGFTPTTASFGALGAVTIAPFPGDLGAAIRSVSISTNPCDFSPPFPWTRTGFDAGIQFTVGPYMPEYIPPLVAGTRYYVNVATRDATGVSTCAWAGRACDMTIELFRP